MRTGIFTGTLIVVLTALLTVGELSVKENRAVMREYSRFADAVEVAVDDACEYLGLLMYDEQPVNSRRAEFLVNVFVEALAAALGKENAVFEAELKKMIALFAVSDGKGSVLMGAHGGEDDWVAGDGLKSADEEAIAITGYLREKTGWSVGETDYGIFLPDDTGLTGYKAAGGLSLLVCMKYKAGSFAGQNKDILVIRNARIRNTV